MAQEGEIVHRRVLLVWGQTPIAEADNWYLPHLLTADMNTSLQTTTVPFGRVVQSLAFRRQSLSCEVLWLSPQQFLPQQVLRHTALLRNREGAAFSFVTETYLPGVLEFSSDPDGLHETGCGST
ncbi:hypothetical protein ACFSE1_03090 [Rhizobium helianthi]|uniref:Uncharacterized protein n=1 Tax=Rhizobium helianthi TaxID=1132695 RepID=A0ABW4LZ42_9HYPH